MQASGSVPPIPQGSTISSSSSRPTQTYVIILKEVLGDEELSLSEIYERISAKYPYFETSEAGWKNTVRHTLSLNPTFQNVPRPYPASGKGGLWKIDPQAPENYTRKRDKKKNKKPKPIGPFTNTSPQPGAERGAKRTRSSNSDAGGGVEVTSSSTANDEAVVAAGPDEDADAEGTDEEVEEEEEDEGVAEGAAAVLTGLMGKAGGGGGGGVEISSAPRLPQLWNIDHFSGRGGGEEGGGRTSQPSYRSAGGSSFNSSSTSQHPTPASSGEYRHPHQHHNDYPSTSHDAPSLPPRSYQRRDSNYSSPTSSSYPAHPHASSSNSYFPPSGPSSTPAYTHYNPSTQVGAPFSAYTGHPGGGPPRLSYSNPTVPNSQTPPSSYQLPPLNPPAHQQQPYSIHLPPPPSIPPFSAMHIAEPSPRHLHVEGGWDRSPDVVDSRLGGRRESSERGGGGGEEEGRMREDEGEEIRERGEEQQRRGGEEGRGWTDGG